VLAIYSTFLQRGYDQLVHDVALQNLPVVFALDRGGLVGADGPTHHGAFDLSFLSCVPNLLLMTPSDEDECRKMLTTAFRLTTDRRAVRYPRGGGTGVAIDKQLVGPADRQGRTSPPWPGKWHCWPLAACWRRRWRLRPKNSMPRWPICVSSSRSIAS
jgi:1-deoxy-D-xylulose-5-phosphate synthase